MSVTGCLINREDKNIWVVLDSKEDKSLAQLCSFLDIPVRWVALRTENGLLELILGLQLKLSIKTQLWIKKI